MSLNPLARTAFAAVFATVVLSAPAVLAETPVRAEPKGAPVPKPAPQPQQPAPAPQVATAQPQIEVVFVLDTTGSMGGLLEGAKRKIYSIASRIAQGRPSPKLKVGLVAYRDVGDEYVTKRFALTDDLDTVFAQLRQFNADGGGDTPEHVGRGLGEAVSKMAWSQNREVMKVIFLVGDAPPAERNDDWNFKHWAQRAKDKHIIVNTVRCGEDAQTESAWRYVAKLTDGSFDTIAQTGGMVAVATPYDAELARVNAELASKTLYSGRAEVQKMNRERAESMAELAPEAAAERISFMKKSRGAAMGGGAAAAPAAVSSAPVAVGGAVDLVERPDALAGLKDDELPMELKGLKKEEQQAKVAQMATERKALEAKAAKLAAERDAWQAKNVSEKEDSFDANVMKGMKTKAARYGVTY
ncbi:VWA domain-containing protein [Myxococcaceae bacterium GXIMD 01537]